MDVPTVTITQGKLRGKIEEDIRRGKFYSFKRIPYGKPPIGDLRFKTPFPADPWQGIRDATQEANPACQYDRAAKKIIGAEDCLYLSLYTPNLPKETANEHQIYLKPVMVFIHSGLFLYGSNKTDMHGPEFLIAEDIVLVVINYRLGLLGLLSLEDPSLDVPGNAAFKDMILALKWAQDNIKIFCGNPNNVTIFGESAGAVSVHLLMLSPLAKGLFHKVIAQSGCALHDWVFGRRDTAKKLCEKMGHNSSNEKEMLQFLQQAAPEEIVRSQSLLQNTTCIINEARYLGLTLEKPSPKAFMTEDPLKIISSGKYNNVPLMMGFNTNEGLIINVIVEKQDLPLYWQNPEINVPESLNLPRGSALSKSVGEKIAGYYNLDPNLDMPTLIKHTQKLLGDNCMLRGIFTSIKMHVNSGNENIFFYRLSLETNLNLFKVIHGIKESGVCHVDDLGYLFKNRWTPKIKPGSVQDIAQRRFARLWTNFAKYGQPIPSTDSMLNVEWKPVTRNALKFLDIGEELSLGENPVSERMAFWDEIYNVDPTTVKL